MNRHVLYLPLWALCVVSITACQDAPLSENARATDLATIRDAEQEERKDLRSKALDAWNKVSDLTVGDPLQIDAAETALEALKTELKERRDEALKPVTDAQGDVEAARSAMNAFSGKAHYSGSRTWCGGNGCGGDCAGSCDFDKPCFDNKCRCVPTCGDRQCGDDGCGGVCGDHLGSCPDGQYCNGEYQCVNHTYEATKCEPSCYNQGDPRREAGKNKVRVSDNSVSSWNQNQNDNTISDLQTLSGYIEVLTRHADGLKAKQAGEENGEAFAQAEKRTRTEIQRLSAILQPWQAAQAQLASAEAAVEAAKTQTAPLVKEIEDEMNPKIEAAQEAIDELKKPAFSDNQKAVWTCDGPTCHTVDGYIQESKEHDLSDLNRAVGSLHEDRKSGLENHESNRPEPVEEDAEKVDEAEEAEPEAEEEEEEEPGFKEYPAWKTQVTNLRDAAAYLEAYEASTERYMGLRSAVAAERTSAAN